MRRARTPLIAPCPATLEPLGLARAGGEAGGATLCMCQGAEERTPHLSPWISTSRRKKWITLQPNAHRHTATSRKENKTALAQGSSVGHLHALSHYG